MYMLKDDTYPEHAGERLSVWTVSRAANRQWAVAMWLMYSTYGVGDG